MSVLNQVSYLQADGSWYLPNVPANMEPVRGAGQNCAAGDCPFLDGLIMKYYNSAGKCLGTDYVSGHYAAWGNRPTMHQGHGPGHHWDINNQNRACFNNVKRVCGHIGANP